MKYLEDMDSYKTLKAQKIHLTLTLEEVDALVAAGRYCLVHPDARARMNPS